MRSVKRIHVISPRLLKILGGELVETPVGLLPDKGAYVWGVADRKLGAGIFNHLMLVGRVAENLAKALIEKDPQLSDSLNLCWVVEAAILHDIVKLYGSLREALSVEDKFLLNLSPNMKENDEDTEAVGVGWLKELGFALKVQEAICDHFPKQVRDDLYWQIVLVADFMASQKIMSVKDRLDDVSQRWTVSSSPDKLPRVKPAEFAISRGVIEEVANKIFTKLGVTDCEFISKYDLNNPNSMTRTERFLRHTRDKQLEQRAIRHVSHFMS